MTLFHILLFTLRGSESKHRLPLRPPWSYEVGLVINVLPPVIETVLAHIVGVVAGVDVLKVVLGARVHPVTIIKNRKVPAHVTTVGRLGEAELVV